MLFAPDLRLMTGLGLYETLRILVPGWFVVAFLDVGVRLALNEAPLASMETVANFLEVIESPFIALGVALIAGLILYAIDVPARTHVMRVGDPPSGKGLPSWHLSKMLSNEVFEGREMSVYFLLLDRYMHPETHRRIYLFGSLFRIFVDLRILAGLFFVLSVMSGLFVQTPHPRLSVITREFVVWTVLTAGIWMSGYAYGIGQHAINSTRKHRSTIVQFLKRHGPSTFMIWPIALLTLAVNTLAVAMSVSGAPLLGTAAVSAVGFALWLRLEIGPPAGIEYWPGVWWRIVQLTGVRLDEGLTSHHRAFLDIATFAPWLVAAAYLTEALGRQAGWVAAWLALLLPLGLILGFHKHEDRLRNAYGDQNSWLDLHSAEIQKLDQTGQLPSNWS